MAPFDFEDCKSLATERQRQICRGESSLPEDTVNKYRLKWANNKARRDAVHQAARTNLPAPVPTRKQNLTRPVETPSHGPGTELAKILASIRIHANEGCGCKERIDQMNRWGVAGCRENFETIVAWLDEGQHQWHWTSKISIGWATLTSGLAFEIDPLHPFRSLVQLAIDRAERLDTERAACTLAPSPQ